jgi:hypothetical protein
MLIANLKEKEDYTNDVSTNTRIKIWRCMWKCKEQWHGIGMDELLASRLGAWRVASGDWRQAINGPIWRRKRATGRLHRDGRTVEAGHASPSDISGSGYTVLYSLALMSFECSFLYDDVTKNCSFLITVLVLSFFFRKDGKSLLLFLLDDEKENKVAAQFFEWKPGPKTTQTAESAPTYPIQLGTPTHH